MGPASSYGSSYGSPRYYSAQSQSQGGTSRIARSQSAQAGPVGSTSRSASRARPALPSQSGRGRRSAEDAEEEEEDEDRGEALIRKRQKERKQLRKAKEKERERERRLAEGDGTTSGPSAPPTAYPEEGTEFARQQRPSGSRSVSRARTPSATRPVRDGYFDTYSGAATPMGHSPREERRAPSIYSALGEDDGSDQASVIEDTIQAAVDEEIAEEEEEEDEADEEDSGDGDDEGVTLKDRQDVSVH